MEYYGTLGPSCADKEILKKMFLEGMTGIRLNLSHGDIDKSNLWIKLFYEVSNDLGIKPALLIDLKGPELRIGKLNNPIILKQNDEILLGEDGIPFPHIVLNALKNKMKILLDDGKILLEVVKINPVILTKVLRGGILYSEKSITLENCILHLPTLTKSDIKNISVAKDYGVTGVMLPFVRDENDLKTLKNALIEAGGNNIKIFAKIENQEGLSKLENFIEYADCIVIARGDLGNSIPLWELPAIQRKISLICKKNKKSFMVVTQLLDSMIEREVPTRAEVSDIFYAVLEGASSLMLTGETAIGKNPVKAMKYLIKTANEGLKVKLKENL